MMQIAASRRSGDNPFSEADPISFGTVSEEINEVLRQGVVAHRTDPAAADRLFREALVADPTALPTYFCLYKIHTYTGDLDEAKAIAEAGLAEGARQAGWGGDWRQWRCPNRTPEGAGRFALYTLKALAFIHLRRQETEAARAMLEALAKLDPEGVVGWPIVAALADGLAEHGVAAAEG